MKKIISVLLSVIMLFSLISVSASASDGDFSVTVATDLHYSQKGANAKEGDYTDKDYSHITTSGELRLESEGIIDAFLKAAETNGSDFVFLAGDLTDKGLKKEHTVVSDKLADFEKRSGKAVYVIPGNHDYSKKTGIEEFKSHYKKFGYGEAVAVDTLSASYVADLNDEYRLIAVDSCEQGKGNHGITQDRAEWIKKQAQQAKADGKKAIVMMHHNLLNHFMFNDLFGADSYIDYSLGLREIFAENNVKYCFTGHTHAQDVKSYTDSDGTVIYEVLTSTLNAYPCPYRVVSFGEEVKIETKNITSIDTERLKGVITDNCYNLASSNFTEYARMCTEYGFNDVAKSYLTEEQIKNLLGADEEANPEICALAEKLAPLINDAVCMPLYVNDETQDGMSIEALAEKSGFSLPDSEYETFLELVIYLYQAYVAGDENYGFFSTEYRVFSTAFTVILNYVLADVSADEYTAVLNFICERFGKKLPAEIISYAADGISRAKGIDILVSSVICSVILQFITDEAPADNNLTLPSYDSAQDGKSEQSFVDKLIKYIIHLFDFVSRFFGTGNLS